jgi:hypothetical protein
MTFKHLREVVTLEEGSGRSHCSKVFLRTALQKPLVADTKRLRLLAEQWAPR